MLQIQKELPPTKMYSLISLYLDLPGETLRMSLIPSFFRKPLGSTSWRPNAGPFVLKELTRVDERKVPPWATDCYRTRLSPLDHVQDEQLMTRTRYPQNSDKVPQEVLWRYYNSECTICCKE